MWDLWRDMRDVPARLARLDATPRASVAAAAAHRAAPVFRRWAQSADAAADRLFAEALAHLWDGAGSPGLRGVYERLGGHLQALDVDDMELGVAASSESVMYALRAAASPDVELALDALQRSWASVAEPEEETVAEDLGAMALGHLVSAIASVLPLTNVEIAFQESLVCEAEQRLHPLSAMDAERLGAAAAGMSAPDPQLVRALYRRFFDRVRLPHMGPMLARGKLEHGRAEEMFGDVSAARAAYREAGEAAEAHGAPGVAAAAAEALRRLG